MNICEVDNSGIIEFVATMMSQQHLEMLTYILTSTYAHINIYMYINTCSIISQ